MVRNKDTIKIILGILQKELEIEEGRNKHIESKVQMMLTLSGILVSAIVILFKTIIEWNMWVQINSVLLLISLGLTVWAVINFLDVIRARTFQKINHNRLLDVDVLGMKPEEVEWNLACDYRDVINKNFDIIEKKGLILKNGSMLIKFAVITFSLVCLIMVFNSIMCERSVDMSKDSKVGDKSTDKASVYKDGKAANHEKSGESGGFGTISVTKGTAIITTPDSKKK